MYNGIFVFEGLEPGDDYSLDANCEGFFPLDDQYKVPFSVKANETTYPMIYLVDTTWIPPTIVYEDYPNPDQPAYLGLPSAFEMTEQAVRDYTEVIKGTVKRTLQSGDSTILLSHEEDGTPHIYLIKSSLNTIDTISTDSILPRDPDNAGDYLALSDIALTCDGKLVGVNYVRCQYSDAQVDDGYKQVSKGTVHQEVRIHLVFSLEVEELHVSPEVGQVETKNSENDDTQNEHVFGSP
jgi:hypothetical protein